MFKIMDLKEVVCYALSPNILLQTLDALKMPLLCDFNIWESTGCGSEVMQGTWEHENYTLSDILHKTTLTCLVN